LISRPAVAGPGAESPEHHLETGNRHGLDLEPIDDEETIMTGNCLEQLE